jgi:hypothetical protein
MSLRVFGWPKPLKLAARRYKVFDLGGGQIAALPASEQWPMVWPPQPVLPTWEGEANSPADALDLAEAYTYLRGLPWSGRAA